MKKIILGSLVASSMLFSAQLSQNEVKEQIAQTKAEIAKLDEKVKGLQAQLPPNEDIVTHAELGFIKTTGNTDTTTFNLDTDLKKKWGNHNAAFSFDAQYGESDNVETKNKFVTELEYGYSFTDRLSATVLAGYKEDKFSGFNYQFYVGPGIKYIAINTASHNLALEANLLYSQDDAEDIRRDAAGNVINYPDKTPASSITKGKTDDYTSYRLKADYAWQIMDSLKFTQEATYRASFEESDKYFIYSKTALISKLTDILSAGISYKIDYTNDVPKGKEHTDKTLTANLILDF